MKLKDLSRVIWSKFLDYTPPLPRVDGNADRPYVAVIYSVSRIGDGIACSILIKAIIKKYNNCKIIVVCSSYSQPSFVNIPNITLMTISDEKNYFEVASTALKIKKNFSVDVLFEPRASNSIGPLIFMRILNAYKNITFRKTKMKMLDQVVLEPNSSVRHAHAKALHLAGIEVDDITFSFYLDELADSKIKEFLFQYSISNYMAINLYGFDKKRKIESSMAIELIRTIKAISKKQIILLCSPQTSNDVSSLSKKFDDVFCFLETKTIHDSAAIIKYSNCLISPDTSLVHIASAFNIPTLAIFLDEKNYIHWPPTATGSQSILCDSMSDLPCDKVASFVKGL